MVDNENVVVIVFFRMFRRSTTLKWTLLLLLWLRLRNNDDDDSNDNVQRRLAMILLSKANALHCSSMMIRMVTRTTNDVIVCIVMERVNEVSRPMSLRRRRRGVEGAAGGHQLGLDSCDNATTTCCALSAARGGRISYLV